MAWSTPATAVSGGQIPAAAMNAVIADLALLGGASTTFGTVASWTGSGGGTAALGTGGTWTGRVRQDSKWVDVWMQLVLGTGFTAPSGGWQFTLPVAARDVFGGNWSARAYDVSVSANQGYSLGVDLTVANIVSPRANTAAAGGGDRQLNTTQPFTWAAGDILVVAGRYEAA